MWWTTTPFWLADADGDAITSLLVLLLLLLRPPAAVDFFAGLWAIFWYRWDMFWGCPDALKNVITAARQTRSWRCVTWCVGV